MGELLFPFAGYSDTGPKSKQLPETTRDAANMRATDPVTGEMCGAQRSGMGKLINAQVNGSAKVGLVTEVSYQKDLVTYTQLSGANVTAGKQTLTPGGGTVTSLVVDRQRNVFGVDVQSEAIAILTEALKEVGSISLPMDGFDSVARTVAIDDQDRVYAAAGNSEGPSNGAVWRFVKTGERWALDWTYETTGDVVKLVWKGGVLCAAMEVRDESPYSELLYFTTLTPGEPFLLWERSAPYPVGDFDLGVSADVLYTSPWNKERGADDEGFGARSVDGTPYDLTNAEERLYFWVAADHLTGYSTGDKIRNWPDLRSDTALWAADYTLAVDDTDRYLQHKAGLGWNGAAEYDAGAFGTMPGVRFDGTQILRSRANLQVVNKTDASTDKLPKNRGPIPGVDVATWVTCLLVRIVPSDKPSPIFGAKGPLDLGLLANADSSTDPLSSSPSGSSGNIMLYTTSTAADLTTVHTTYENELNVALVTILHDADGAGAGLWRVNGTAVDAAFTWNEHRLWSTDSSSAFLMGMPHLTADAAGTDPFGSASGLDGFQGAIAEWVTVLGTTSVAPHDTAPSTGDIEDIEGYIAHKWGVQSLLPGGHAHAATPPTGAWSLTTGFDPTQSVLLDQKAIVAKYRASGGGVAWAYNEYVGAGDSIVAGIDGAFYTMGGREDRWLGGVGTSLGVLARKAYDDGSTYEIGTASSATLTISGQPTNLDTVTIDSVVYTFRTVVAGLANTQVLIGATAAESLENLALAIGLEGEAGTNYGDGTGAGDQAPHHAGYAVATSATTMVFYTHLRGSAKDGLVLSTNITGPSVWTWGGNTAGGDAATTWHHEVGSGVFWWQFNWADLDTLTSMAVDGNGDVYLTHPSSADDVSNYTTGGVSKLEGEGETDGTTTQLWYWNSGYTGGASNLDRPYNSIVLGYQPDYGAQTITGPEFAYVATTGHKQDATWTSSLARYNLHRLTLVDKARTGETSARGYRNVAVAGGNLVSWVPGASSFTAPANGTGAFDASPRRIVGAELYGKLYLSDGINAKVYDARLDRVADWVATKGSLPPRIEQLVRWRARIVAVSADDPHNWHMARLGDPLDWDEYPGEAPTAEQPVSGNNPDSLGRLAEPITALIPLSDDILVVGCTGSIYVMRGDPMAVALGGYGSKVIGIITDEQGIAPGSAWTKDQDGSLYVFGSRGALLRVSPGATGVQDISTRRIRRQLESIDWSTHYAHLAWNYEDRGLHVFLLPWGATGTDGRTHWFWEASTGRWRDGGEGSFWPDTLGYEPSAVAQFNADTPAQRLLVLGCEDGYIRKWDRTASSDDGLAIASHIVSGPLGISEPGQEGAVRSVTIELAEARGGCSYELYSSRNPTLPDVAWVSGDLHDGKNDTILRGTRGAYVWLRLGNAAVSENWAFQRAEVETYVMGATR